MKLRQNSGNRKKNRGIVKATQLKQQQTSITAALHDTTQLSASTTAT